MTRSTEWSQVPADNNIPAKGGHQENMDRSDVNDQVRDNLASLRQFIEGPDWVDLLEENADDYTVSRVSTTKFNVTDDNGDDATLKFLPGRWCKVTGTGTPTVAYGYVASVVHADPVLTVTLAGIVDAAYAASDLPDTTITKVECFFLNRVRTAAFHPVGTTASQAPAQIPTIDDLGDGALLDQGTGNGFDADTVDGAEAVDLGYDGLSNRNALINGAMNVWQRGSDHTNVADQTYAADRWKVLMETTALWDCDREDSLVPDGFRHSCKLQASGTTNTKVCLFQVITGENSAEIIGNGKASLSYRLLLTGATGFSGVRAAILEWTGAEDAAQATWISAWRAENEDPAPAASWVIKNIPSADEAGTDADWQTITIEDVTISSSATNLAVAIWLDDKSYSDLDAFYVSGVQLVPGANATAFVYPRFEDELHRCRSYYAKTFDYAVTPAQNLSDYKGVLRTYGQVTTGAWDERWELGVWLNNVAGAYTGATLTGYSPEAASDQPYNVAAASTYGGGAVVAVIGGTSVVLSETAPAAGDQNDELIFHATLECEF